MREHGSKCLYVFCCSITEEYVVLVIMYCIRNVVLVVASALGMMCW